MRVKSEKLWPLGETQSHFKEVSRWQIGTGIEIWAGFGLVVIKVVIL